MVGQHIRALKSGRWIHAIDCGDETVLHLMAEAAPPRVRRAYRPEFVASADTVEAVAHRERTFPPKEVVRRAYSRASDPTLAAMFHDSEAFAQWCTTGRLPGPRNIALEVPGAAPGKSAPRAGRKGAPTPSNRKPAAKARARPARPAKRRVVARKVKARAARPAKRAAPRKKVVARKAKAKPARRTSGRR